MSRTVLLGDVLEPISETFKFRDEPVVFLNTSDIEAGKFLNQNLVMSGGLPGQAKKRIKNGDILFSEIRPANKRYAFVNFDAPNYVVSTKLMVLRSKDGVYPRFIYHWITAPERLNHFQEIAENRSGTFPQITFDTIKRTKLALPEPDVQRKIADFIDQIDEKIELSRKMNETLEQMGQALFRHYFIDNPEAKSWPKKKLSDFADVVTGKGSTKSLLTEGGQYPLYGANGIMGTSDSYLFDEDLIMTGRVGTLGTVRISSGKLWASDNVLVIKPRKYFGYVCSNVKTFDFQSLNRGSTQPLVTQTDLKNQIILEPPVKLLDNFESSFMNFLKKIQNNDKQNLSLVSLRDLLLPRLISGKIKV